MKQRWFRVGRVRILGARVYLHRSVLIVVALLALMSFQSPIHAAVAIVSYFSIIFIHEFGHAWMAQRLGYEVEAIRLAFLHGSCEHEEPDTEWDHILIAWAGVLMQLAVAIPVLACATLFDNVDFGYAAPAIVFLGYVNLLIALANLAPAHDMDGATAWRVIPVARRWWSARQATKHALASFRRRRR